MIELISLTVPSRIQEFPLDENSNVFIVGAWEGNHAQFYVDTYNPNMYLFEPQAEKLAHLGRRFADKANVKLFQLGLGDHSGYMGLSRVGTDRCSCVARLEGADCGGESVFEGPYADARMVEMGYLMKYVGIKDIDLILMNCEGYEFRLLPWMITTGIIKHCKYLMVQFHLHHEGSWKFEDIKAKVSHTHQVRDDYEPAWIVWERRHSQ